MIQRISHNSTLFTQVKDFRGITDRFKDLWLAMKEEKMSRQDRILNPLRLHAETLFPKPKRTPFTCDLPYYDDIKQPWLKDRSSEKLVIFIHGLNSSPLSFSKYFLEMEKLSKTTSYFMPYVYQKGNCSLIYAAEPILQVARTYTKLYPKNPIFIVGHSNGARIASYLEQRLQAKEIHLLSIAGPHGGSIRHKIIDTLKLYPSFGLSKEIVKELSYLGSFSKNFLHEWQNKSKEALQMEDKKIKRVFFAAADDLTVFPSKTSFPKLPNSSYHLLAPASHVTILEKVFPLVMNYIQEPAIHQGHDFSSGFSYFSMRNSKS